MTDTTGCVNCEEKDNEITELKAEITKRDKEINYLGDELADCEAHIDEVEFDKYNLGKKLAKSKRRLESSAQVASALAQVIKERDTARTELTHIRNLRYY